MLNWISGNSTMKNDLENPYHVFYCTRRNLITLAIDIIQ